MKKEKTIFVIEDSRIISEIISIELKNKFNCEVLIFDNGDDVINQITHHSPDLIILDYNFNGDDLFYSNGLDLLIELRNSYNIPVIMFSGQRDKEIAIELIHHGANDYIDKDNNDFIEELLKSTQDILTLGSTKKDITSIKSKIKKNLYFLAVLFAITFLFFNSML